MISCRTILLFSWIGKVFVIIYGGKVRGKNMVDVFCMSNGLKQWVDVALTNIAINYLIDCLIYFSLSLSFSRVSILYTNSCFNECISTFLLGKNTHLVGEMKVVQRFE